MTVRGVGVRGIVRGAVDIRPDRFTLVLTALAVLGGALVLSRQVAYGVGLELDSAHYIGVAKKILVGEGFTEPFGGGGYNGWAPLYPALLAGASFLTFDPRDVAGPLNAVIFALTVFVAGQWLRRRIRSRLLVAGACLAVTLAIPLTRAASYAMSETTFILFATLSLIRIDEFLLGGKRTDLGWAGVFTALACLTRYLSVTVVVAVLPLLLLRPNVALLDRVKHCVAYALISLTPVGLWMLRNALLTGKPTGAQGPSSDTLPEILSATLADLSRWALLWLPSDAVRIAASALAAMVLLAMAIAVWYASLRSLRSSDASQQWSSFALFGGFALVYLGILVVVQAVTFGEPAGGRYLYPMYIPLLFAGVFVLDRQPISQRGSRGLPETVGALPIIGSVIHGSRAGPVRLLPVIVALAGSLWLLAHAPLTVREIWLANGERGLGLAKSTWVDSEVLRYMRDAPIDGRVLSSIPTVVLYADVLEYVFLSHELDAARRKIGAASDGDYVVWFYSNTIGYTYDDADLRALPELELVADLPDGIVFRIAEGEK